MHNKNEIKDEVVKHLYIYHWPSIFKVHIEQSKYTQIQKAWGLEDDNTEMLNI